MPHASNPTRGPNPPSDLARVRAYRQLIYLAVAVLVAGSAGIPLGHRLLTSGIYLGLGLITALLEGSLDSTRDRPGRRRRFWPLLLALDVGAQSFVLARMGGPGSPYLLLLALPILVWGVQRGIAAGIWTASLAVSADVILRCWPGRISSEPASVLAFHSLALLLLGVFAGLLGRRIQQREVMHRATERELEQVQLDAESIVSQLSRGLLCLDGQGRITLQNSRAETLLGPLLELRPGRTLVELLPGSRDRHAALPLVRHLLDRLVSLREESGEIWLEWPGEGEPKFLPLEVTTSPILDHQGRSRGILVLLSDLTERSTQEAARRRKERLALIGELAAGMAHEIRNSLKPITGSVELLRRVSPTGDLKRDALMEIILRESESLENFVTEFLNFARDKNLEMQLLPLEKILGEEWESLNSLPESPFHLMRPEPGQASAWVRVDQSALRQVVRNLGINALEAGGGGIDLGWRCEGSEAVIFLRDRGPGIPESIRPQVFEPFFTTKPNGTGLGLAIARDLADRMGGRLTLEPNAGGGTEACIRLPLQPPPAREEVGPEAAIQPGTMVRRAAQPPTAQAA